MLIDFNFAGGEGSSTGQVAQTKGKEAQKEENGKKGHLPFSALIHGIIIVLNFRSIGYSAIGHFQPLWLIKKVVVQ